MTKNKFKILTVSTLLCVMMFPVVQSTASASEPFLGEIKMVGFNFAPRGYAFCDGQILAISQYSALFALLGTTYGGDGRTTFGLPDLKGRVAIHPGTGPGLSTKRWGDKGGYETNTLAVSNLPSHTHSATAAAVVNATNSRGNAETPENNTWAQKMRDKDYSTSAPDVEMHPDLVDVTVTVANTGGETPVNNMQPYLCIYHVIALQGLFPSRN